MSLGLAPRQGEVFARTATFCEGRVAEGSIFGLLHRECHRLFADELFADVFCDGRGRRSVPPMIVAVGMVLQRIEGCSDREAVDRFTYDARWKYACGGLDFAFPGFVHTVLVDMRARLAASERPDRIFEVVLETAKRAGLVGRRRVLDSTALYDAVATMDTVTLVRSAIRGLLGACDADTEAELRGLLGRDDDYRAAGKPVCDYEDAAARAALVDALAKDARAALIALDGRDLPAVVRQAAEVLAAVVGQDLDEDERGVFRIARRVAQDRVISTVDPQARHGHKTSSRGFDGYKGHVAIDPDSELITATAVAAANVGDAAVADGLLADDLPDASADQAGDAESMPEPAAEDQRLVVYGDSGYGAGVLIERLQQADGDIRGTGPAPTAPAGHFTKDDFDIDLQAGAVTCPAGQIAPLRTLKDGQIASFGARLREVPAGPPMHQLAPGPRGPCGPPRARLGARARPSARPGLEADYNATRPTVERK